MQYRILLIFSFFIMFFGFANAQGVSTNIQGIDIKISNTSPAPGQTITINAESYISNLNSSSIEWKVNNVSYKKGVGVTSIEIQAPPLGKKTNISITAVTPEGRTMSNSVSLSSGNVDLILEPEGYTPPFFQGKIALSYQNNYRIVAMPHLADSSGKEYDPQTLVYQWSKDSRLVQDQSGYGKQVFVMKEDVVPRQRLVSVKVFARDGNAQAEKFIPIEAKSPFIVFYKDDPLYGTLFNSAITSTRSLGKSGEMSVLAVPFGFNKPSSSVGNLVYTWFINSVKQDALSLSQSITLRSPGGVKGSSDVQLTVTNTEDFLEKSQNGFTVTYGSESNNSEATTPNTLNNNGI